MIDKKSSIARYFGFMLIFITLLMVVACEPETKIEFDNQRNQDITLFIAHVREDRTTDGLTNYGTILAETVKTIHITFLGDEWVNRFVIKDSNENIISSHDYSRYDLKRVNWKIVIPK
jgi:hypothetical protein